MALKEHLPVDMVMNLDVPKQIIMDRLTDRWIHPKSGRVYAYAYRPPKVCWLRSRPRYDAIVFAVVGVCFEVTMYDFSPCVAQRFYSVTAGRYTSWLDIMVDQNASE